MSQATYIDLYTSLLRLVTCDDEDLSMELTLGSVLHDSYTTGSNFSGITENSEHGRCEPFQDEELVTYGAPIMRRHLASSTTRRLQEEVNNTLRDIAEFFYAGQADEDLVLASNRLPEHIQARKDNIDSKQLELAGRCLCVSDLLNEIKSTRNDFNIEIKQLRTTTFLVLDAARTASTDHLMATLEAVFQMLSAVRERARRSFYNHPRDTGSVPQALAIAYGSLKEEEKKLNLEAQKLDQQLHDYETMLKLVDGDSGYRQIVQDWLEVKQGTDECLKDLRRLGWTGD